MLADLLKSSVSTLRQQLREWCYDAVDKKGEHRQEVDVTLYFGPLLSWIVSRWPKTDARLALGMDAMTLADRFTVLCISVLYRGCAIPVAWKIVRGNEKGAWEPYWKALLTSLKGSVPKRLPGAGLSRARVICAPPSSATLSGWAGIPSCALTQAGQSTSRGSRTL